MPSTDADTHPLQACRERILGVARASIEEGLRSGQPLLPDCSDDPEILRQPAATFVTLHRHGQLRGCIGTLEAYRPLLEDVASHAFAAAFHDHRFDPLLPEELDGLKIEVSVLTPSEIMECHSEAELLQQLKPGEDGVTLEFGHHRGTFLPQVWEQLPEPARFLNHLKLKAGLAVDFWDPDIRVSRYHSLKIV